jgi:thiamine monophosphate kinase
MTSMTAVRTIAINYAAAERMQAGSMGPGAFRAGETAKPRMRRLSAASSPSRAVAALDVSDGVVSWCKRLQPVSQRDLVFHLPSH